MSDAKEWVPDPNQNAYENTPKGAYAYVAKSAKVDAELGYWTKIGDGAIVPASVTLGNWSHVGHFSRIGKGVVFGPWAAVGMDCIVDSGAELGSHEYVRSGYHRHRDGRLTRLSFPAEDLLLHHLYDNGMNAHGINMGPQAIPNDIAEEDDRRAANALKRLAGLLPAYLERRHAARQERQSVAGPVQFLRRVQLLLGRGAAHD